MSRKVRIPIKSPREIEAMRVAGATASAILQTIAKAIQPGMTTKEWDPLESTCRHASLSIL